MPEMPEVEVVRRGLHQHLVGARIHAARALHPRAVRRQPGGPDQFSALLAGRAIVGTGRRGKFLWLVTDDPDVLLAAHLGMSGQFRVQGAAAGPGWREAHVRARFELGDRDVLFLDQRTFGWVWAVAPVTDPNGVEVPLPAQGIARDPGDPAFDGLAVARAMHRHRVAVKRLLLDQSLVSGIGNIYADEALWAAGIHPRRRADRLTVNRLREVLASATAVMAEALAAGGTSFDSLYVDVNGRSGYFERGLAVYGRAGRPCPRCGAPIRREVFGNRSSHFCPTCQRVPRARH